MRKRWLIAFLSCWPVLTWAHDESNYNLPQGVTPISHDIYNLHMIIFWICVAIAIVVFSVMFYSLVMHRKSRGVTAAQFHEHPVVEFVWALIPFLILVGMAIPATKVLMRMEDTKEPDINIKVTGYQWKWKYDYLDENISFFSNLSTPMEQIENKQPKGEHYLLEVDNPLVVPIHKKIRFLVTANDVLHSWWVPQFGIKRDAVPGFINEAWATIEKPGIYRGQCAELCGKNHGYMPIVVIAKNEQEYQQWIKDYREKKRAEEASSDKTWTMGELMDKGREVYNKACAACHMVDGTGMPPTFPAIKASSVSVGKPISRHINIILHGVKGSAMQAFAEQLNDLEVAAVVTYERNAFNNNTEDVVQPKDVKPLRNKQS